MANPNAKNSKSRVHMSKTTSQGKNNPVSTMMTSHPGAKAQSGKAGGNAVRPVATKSEGGTSGGALSMSGLGAVEKMLQSDMKSLKSGSAGMIKSKMKSSDMRADPNAQAGLTGASARILQHLNADLNAQGDVNETGMMKKKKKGMKEEEGKEANVTEKNKKVPKKQGGADYSQKV